MSTDTMESALDAAQVFANSANAVRVFEALTDGPTTNRDLAEQTGAARSTIARILDRGESRGWIESEGSRYELTNLGETMIEEFRNHLRTLEGIQHLGEDFQYLPEPAHELDYRHFRDATITKPTPENPAAPFDRIPELFHAHDTHNLLTPVGVPGVTRVAWELWTQDKLGGDGVVIDARFFETLRNDPERAEPWIDWAQAGLLWVHDDVSIAIHIFDDLVGIGLGERHGANTHVAGFLESTNPAVVSWAQSLFEDYLSEAEPLTAEMFPVE